MTIMVVDNDPVYLNLLSEVLRLHSFSTITAQNGEVALNLLKEQPVDLVISDISMPKMNGMNLFRYIREDDSLRRIPFAWNSGYRELRDVVEVEDPETDFKLDKSMPIPSLLYFVSSLANKKKSVSIAAGVSLN